MSDDELDGWTVGRKPTVDGWALRDARHALARAKDDALRTAASLKALVPDEGGTVSLTPTQLKGFFGL